MHLLETARLEALKRLEETRVAQVLLKTEALKNLGLQPLSQEEVDVYMQFGKCPTCMFDSIILGFGIVKIGEEFYDYLQLLDVLNEELVYSRSPTLYDIIAKYGMKEILDWFRKFSEQMKYSELENLFKEAINKYGDTPR
jgi:hypothetical protein